jgi:outer membrane protein OmpA-like peptidoglycan-associated protein
MTSVKKIFSVFIVILISTQLFAQTKKDSTTAEIKQQAIEMRDKVNRYMADKLLMDDLQRNPALLILLDSVSKMIANQQNQIEQLKQKLSDLDGSVEKQIIETKGDLLSTQMNLASKEAKPGGFKQISDNRMVFFLPFDVYKLNSKQKNGLQKFIDNKKYKSVIINSYTDAKGTEEYNSALAEKRANEIELYLTQKSNVNIKKIPTAGCGAGDVNNPNWCRRVEITLN